MKPFTSATLFLPGLTALLALLLQSGCQPPPPDTAKPPVPSARTGAVETVSVDEQPEPPFPEVSFMTGDLGGKRMLMHYMPWYEAPPVRRSWGTHWTGHQREHNPDVLKENGLPDIWSHYHPLIGLYDSTDRDVLECQLLQMKLAGVNGVIADWYGTAPHGDFPPIHDATKALFDACKRYGMTFAACYEDRTIQLLVDHFNVMQTNEVTGHLVGIFQWMQDNWFTADHYEKRNNRPLLLNFGPMYDMLRDPAPWNAAMEKLPVRPDFFALHHLWKQAGGDGGFTWVHFEPFEPGQSRETVMRRINESFTWFTDDPEKAIVSVYPGFHDVYGQGGKVLKHNNGDVLRDTLNVSITGPWDTVQLVTWNDYGEGTMIEPTHEFDYLFLEILQEARRNEIGEGFIFTADDLRLPARLLELRRSGEIPAAELNKIAALLAEGRCGEARERMAALQPD